MENNRWKLPIAVSVWLLCLTALCTAITSKWFANERQLLFPTTVLLAINSLIIHQVLINVHDVPKKIFFILLLPAALFAYQPSTTSSDFNDYISCAQEFIKGVNPYETPCNIDHTRRYIYGPIFLLLSATPHLFTSENLIHYFSLKTLMMIAQIANVVLLFKLLAVAEPQSTALQKTLLYATGLIIMFESLQGGHNDTLVVTSLLGSLYAYSRGDITRSSIFLFLGGLIKMIPFFMLPFMIAAHFHHRAEKGCATQKAHSHVTILLIAITLAVAIISLPYFHAYFHNVIALSNIHAPSDLNIFPLLIYGFIKLLSIPPIPALHLTGIISLALGTSLLIVLYLHVWRSGVVEYKKMIKYFLLTAIAVFTVYPHWAMSWYLLWILPLILLSTSLSMTKKLFIGAMMIEILSIALPVPLAIIISSTIMLYYYIEKSEIPFQNKYRFFQIFRQ
ncbi:MAG: hypothetical protein AB1352_04010 [Patescibacteria group bacterium]